jgi:hypothetical protein
MKRTAELFVCALAAAGCAVSQTTGIFQGSVAGDDGAQLPNATILFRRIPQRVVVGGQLVPAPGEAIVNSSASADAAGAFNIGSLPPGTYSVCAKPASGPYLDSCRWSSPVVVSVAAVAPAQLNFVLKRGVFLNLRVNDPYALLPPLATSPFAEPALNVGVIFGNGAYVSLVNTSVDQSGRSYQAPIPVGQPLKLWVFSRRFALTGPSGSPLPLSGGVVPFTAAADQDQSFIVTVLAVAPPVGAQ